MIQSEKKMYMPKQTGCSGIYKPDWITIVHVNGIYVKTHLYYRLKSRLKIDGI